MAAFELRQDAWAAFRSTKQGKASLKPIVPPCLKTVSSHSRASANANLMPISIVLRMTCQRRCLRSLPIVRRSEQSDRCTKEPGKALSAPFATASV